MYFKYCAWLTFAAASLAANGPLPDHYVLHERRDAPSKMVKHDRLGPDKLLQMRIGLRQNNLDKAYTWLMNVSDPDSPHFGRHWSEEQVITAFQPSEDTVGQVMDWLESAGVERSDITQSRNKLWLVFHISTKQAENLLYTKYHEYRTRSGTEFAACDEYYIPKHLRSCVDFIKPGVKGSLITARGLKKRGHKSRRWISIKKRLQPRSGWLTSLGNLFQKARRDPDPSTNSSDNGLAKCKNAITQRCIQALYHFEPQDLHAHVSPNNSMGIYEAGDYYTQKNLNNYFANFSSYVPNGTHPTLHSIDGGKQPTGYKYAYGESDVRQFGKT